MITSLETKTNIQSWIETGRTNPVEQTKNSLNNSLLTTIEKWEIVDRKWNDRLAIRIQTIEATKPLTNETHFIVEEQLAQMFWLDSNKIAKLENDFKEPMTLTWVLSDAEWFWDSHDIVKA